ncbi:MAG TPA: exo-alpha-sialidase [Planctomycetaceae bacterium]|nr:exo-alpha-sialidase [Planctomycetaceae bacterium]
MKLVLVSPQTTRTVTASQSDRAPHRRAHAGLVSLAVFLSAAVSGTRAANAQSEDSASGRLRLVSCRMIWDSAPHNAFTDLIRYRDQWVCAFREASKHDGGVRDSRIRILTSDDGSAWTDAGALSDPRGDVRDAKLSITPQGQLMLLTAIQRFDTGERRQHQSIGFFTGDLKTWNGPIDASVQDRWLWGLSWHKDVGYSIGYQADSPQGDDYNANLYTTRDGRRFELHVEGLEQHTNKPNESAIVFEGDTAYCLLRAFGPAYLGTASPPYNEWTWTRTAVPVGGPELIRLPDHQQRGSRLLGGGRLYLPDNVRTTSLFHVDPQAGSIQEALRLPSGGDTSYPGMVWHEGSLSMSYYSSHEGRASIYFAVVGRE